MKKKNILLFTFVLFFTFSCSYEFQKDVQSTAELMCEREQLYEKLFDFDEQTDAEVTVKLDVMDKKIKELKTTMYEKYASEKQKEEFDKMVHRKMMEICNK